MWIRQGLAIVGMSVGVMVQWRVMLGALVAPVESPGGPIKTELILGEAETQPIKPHAHIFGLTRHDCIVRDNCGGGVVSLKRRRCLRPTHFNECLA